VQQVVPRSGDQLGVQPLGRQRAGVRIAVDGVEPDPVQSDLPKVEDPGWGLLADQFGQGEVSHCCAVSALGVLDDGQVDVDVEDAVERVMARGMVGMMTFVSNVQCW
jgi:hypothetical protein